jgi:hypothetical protein
LYEGPTKAKEKIPLEQARALETADFEMFWKLFAMFTD